VGGDSSVGASVQEARRAGAELKKKASPKR